ncbi:epsin-1 isoform X2 [Protopterus annectens]|uniref:epsin-1 isoform X2 n=1 Tax=Protopterus annectens TaxID=7888 RepID=UPI001CFB77A7|nr:epsin-1 isoform X2 [Protopterus annectens]
MSTSSLRRQVKNIVHNYSEAEIKVREATSNDPWGPSSSLMSEIADLTYNVVAFSEIMGMIWRRLNDHGKNWRHVYKAMTLMEYLIKTGSERVAQQCKENIYAIQTLKDFQYVDRDGKDQGVNVREKAKQLVALLKDDERLKEERAHALKTKEKLAQTTTTSSSSAPSLSQHGEQDQAWPQSSGEEELQLQLALAMSKEEAEQPPPELEDDMQLQLALSLSKEEHDKEERIRRGDDLRLQMALEESRKEAPTVSKKDESSLMDLADVFTSTAPAVANDPWGGAPIPPPATVTVDPWGASGASAPAAASDPWGEPTVTEDPWSEPGKPGGGQSDPWGGTTSTSSVPPTAAVDPWVSAGSVPLDADSTGDPWSSTSSVAAPVKSTSDPWAPLPSTSNSAQQFSDPWGGSPSKPTTNGTANASFDPFVAPAGNDELSEFDSLRPTIPKTGSSTGELDLLAGEVPVSRSVGSKSPDVFDMTSVSGSLNDMPSSKLTPAARKTPESFLGPNAALVDLDSLISKPSASQPAKTSNPFLSSGVTTPSATNPFQTTQQTALTLNQLRASPVMSLGQPVTPVGTATNTVGAPFNSVSPMVSVSPAVTSMPLTSISPMMGVQPVGTVPPMANVPMVPVTGMPMMPPGVTLPQMMTSPQMVPQPVAPSTSSQSMGSTNPFLL